MNPVPRAIALPPTEKVTPPAGSDTSAHREHTDGLVRLNETIVACERCPRLRAYCAGIAREKRRAYRDQQYWGRPVPSFGDPLARLLLLGLAPGAHGSNRTGRPFTGDGSGAFLYPLLYEAGFASQPNATARDDGMRLIDCWISAVVRCAPPDNKPTLGELAACSPYLDQELALLQRLRVVVALGKIAFDAFTAYLVRSGQLERRSGLVFAHGANYAIPGRRRLLATYHPSLQNTNTGRLTAAMLLAVLRQARTLSEG